MQPQRAFVPLASPLLHGDVVLAESHLSPESPAACIRRQDIQRYFPVPESFVFKLQVSRMAEIFPSERTVDEKLAKINFLPILKILILPKSVYSITNGSASRIGEENQFPLVATQPLRNPLPVLGFGEWIPASFVSN